MITKVYAIWVADCLESGHPYLAGLYSTREKARKKLEDMARSDKEAFERVEWDTRDTYRTVTGEDFTLGYTYIQEITLDKEEG